jgi:hypothetical protein
MTPPVHLLQNVAANFLCASVGVKPVSELAKQLCGAPPAFMQSRAAVSIGALNKFTTFEQSDSKA